MGRAMILMRCSAEAHDALHLHRWTLIGCAMGCDILCQPCDESKVSTGAQVCDSRTIYTSRKETYRGLLS
jgi:hypothetical protein